MQCLPRLPYNDRVINAVDHLVRSGLPYHLITVGDLRRQDPVIGAIVVRARSRR